MAANDTTSNPLFAGIQGAGNDIGAGIRQAILNYRDRQQREAALTGQLESMIQSHGPAGLQALSPDGQKLAQKFIAGDASYKDKLQLMGEGQTALTMQQQAQDAQAKQTANQQAAQALAQTQQDYAKGQISLEQAQRQNAFIKNILAGGQQGGSQQPQGGGMPQGTGPLANPQQAQGAPQAPIPATAVNPGMSGAINRYVGMTGGLPPTSTLNDMMQQAGAQAAQAKTPIGIVPDGVDYKDGLPVASKFKQVYKIGAGTPAEQTQIDDGSNISVAPGQLPPGNLLNRATFAPLTPPEIAALKTPPPNNPNDPTWQKDLMDANTNVAQSAISLSKAQVLQQAATLMNTGQMAGPKMNALLGTPAGQWLKQFMGGSDGPSAYKQALADNVSGMLSSLRGPNGSLGTRVTGNEWQQTMDSLGKTTFTPSVIQASADNQVALAQRQYNIDKAFATYRAKFPAGEASSMATEQFGQPPSLNATTSTNPATAILQKYGLPTP